jgi:hypothetical protein
MLCSSSQRITPDAASRPYASERDRVDDLHGVGRVEQVGFACARRAAAHVHAAHRVVLGDDHGAAGWPFGEREVANLDAVHGRQRHVGRRWRLRISVRQRGDRGRQRERRHEA